MGSGYAKKKKEAKIMEQQFLEMEAALEEKRYEGQAGNGLISVIINGKCDLISVKVQPQCLDPEEPEVVEDLFRAAFKEAKSAMDKEMSLMRAGMPF
ncbi:YbaB/EbfC family nucleoid-associated protein [Chlamydia gallinacea]|uniref:Nucleoid-associated protein M787_003480 n=2 Tax=Chlamydia gallinacea TaxID=1457153 RepID=A0A173DZM0_9CHLA|nr:YbaB/EbfC family nucleoid-associated protein [Chlamydia gallinacea]EYE62954.1 DNA-binding protein, YbaB/EbfC family [Bacteroides fragilis str. S6L5]ANG66370.1 nucleoid-associated protein [Chlamydia gallinacea 08-1274/3]AQT77433.1 nucleoid-associated protein, YbaB/EbfC family [Chlamydia gallinacea]MBX6680187.1 YbaB/EbfC family nucleoid-associated protein [Chlamydia gallinacea]MBX6687701.1 YbaB/EbfC family nucleoid-associated protein [Chlamydia gallinacea]